KLFNAAAVIALITIIVRLPLFGERKHTPFSTIAFFLIFCLYWVANPALGDTSLWLVGSANYLWTNVLSFLFLLFFIRETKSSNPGVIKTALLFLFGIIAGCTNENVGLTTFCLISFLTIAQFHAGHRQWRLVLYILGFGIGMAALLLAPGNMDRAQHFPDWYALNLGEQLYIHFIKRFPDAMVQYWEVFLVLALLIKFQPKLSKETRFYVILFVLASFIANAILMPAPAIPKRALSGGFIYLLIAASFVLYSFITQPGIKTRVLKLITLVCGLHFCVSYALMHHAYQGTFEQAKIRENLIKQGIKNGDSHIEIPKFTFTQLLRKRERFDTYFNGSYMAKYYGTTAKISEYDVH
ncbi:MAG TPA: DUF6056 family protein, partial [Eoetvoesiella sp.]